MDVIADVMAGAESIYTASKRARDDSQMENAASRPETVVWPAQNDATTTANTQADSRPQDSVYSNSRSDVEEEVVQLYHPVDIEEDEEGYSLFMDVPGLQKSDIKVLSLPHAPLRWLPFRSIFHRLSWLYDCAVINWLVNGKDNMQSYASSCKLMLPQSWVNLQV